MRVTLIEGMPDDAGGYYAAPEERRFFHLPARLRVEGDELPCTVELRLTYGPGRVIVEELALKRTTGEQLPITSKTLRDIKLEEIRRRALEHVTSVLVPTDAYFLEWPKELAPFELADIAPKKRFSPRTARAITAATTAPRRGRAPSLTDAEKKTLRSMVAKGKTIHEIRAKFPFLSRTVAYRMMKEAKVELAKKGRRK